VLTMFMDPLDDVHTGRPFDDVWDPPSGNTSTPPYRDTLTPLGIL